MKSAESASGQLTAGGSPGLPEQLEPWPGCRVWRMFQPAIRTEMACCLIETPSGGVLIDPFEEMLAALENGPPIHAALLTSGNHERAIHQVQERFRIPVFAPLAAAAQHFEKTNRDWQDVTSPNLPKPLRCVALPGFGPGEVAFYDPRNGGCLHLGDALINLPETGFTRLPAKYCENLTTAEHSLQALCRLPFDCMTFAHGLPITGQAHDLLSNLLTTKA